ncbi:hypothetical protein DVH24_033013 [Malus domestica]|uniref:phosphopyruvate hydratase n=1 Tax=Malus domestica TaxID=3750 RepID=A0A498INK3_MALDO|nr:hypothetical protein DVH24_033013 [Malus domestica]
MPYWLCQLLLAKLELLKRRHDYFSVSIAKICIIFSQKCLSKDKHQVPLYKHIADLSGNGHLTLPVPAFTVISGGKRAGNNLAIQEIMILPIGASKFEEALQMGSETYHHLKAIITEKYGAHGCNVGEDGGFAPNISRQVFFAVKEVLDLVKEAISRTDYNDRIKLAIDVAATDFCIGTKYDLDYKSVDKGQNFKSADDMIGMYKELCRDYMVFQVVGDDLITSSPKRIKRAIEESTCNALLVKINQIGTVTETIEVMKLAKDAHWGVVMSHRCGETEDSFIADLAVGLSTGQIKAGAPCRPSITSHMSGYKRTHDLKLMGQVLLQLLQIEEELGDNAFYAGEEWRQSP